MSREEVARLLRRHPRWVARHIEPTYRMERLVLYEWDDALDQIRVTERVDVSPSRREQAPRRAKSVSPEALALAEELAP